MENLPKLINQDDNTTIQINNSCFSIGRSLTCNHIIECLGVSRVHCFIKKNPTKYTLIDRSTNGTTVNDQLVKFNGCLDLNHGDLIKFGNLSYKFDDGSVIDKKMEKIDDRSEQVPTTSQINEKTDDNGTELLETSTSTITTMTTSTTAEIIDELLPVAEEFEVSFELVNCTNNNENVDKNDVNEDNQKLDKSIDNAMDTELTCSICSELFIKAVTLSCSHTFCKYCIQEWRKNRTQCPICRQRIITTTPTIVLDNLIESLITKRSKDEQEQRHEQIKLREEKLAGPSHQQQSRKRRRTSSAHHRHYDDGQSVIELLTDDEDDDEDPDNDDDDDDDSLYDSYIVQDIYEASDNEDEDEDDAYDGYNGVPGHYYGGYGRCYVCGDHGHWANGCPLKRRH